MEIDFLPPHLRKYVVEQNYAKYTPEDQAVWRYILRQLKDFLSRHAHETYVEGLTKTGIEIERIPRIEDVSKKLQEFGWRALPVSGFIPPAAFMELQALGVLPIASDMRSIDHLLYTPAPDIVHEAAGHAPILVHPEFAEYLRKYAQVAKKAIISKEDLDLYEAIRDLSDLKENPHSTLDEIKAAEAKLNQISLNMSHISEAAELSRMNWWTAEYGLIGNLDQPKIFGAGLLSSVGESKWCLSDKVKKIPLTVDCIKTGYDITEPQPQLFVTPDFSHLSQVLEDMADQMAFRTGGMKGLSKILQAQSINTAELSSGLQISGVLAGIRTNAHHEPTYLQFSGPTQLSYQDKQLPGHDKSYHQHGFGTPVGELQKFPGRCPSELSNDEWKSLGIVSGEQARLEFSSGVVVEGRVKSLTKNGPKTIMIAFENAKAELEGHILFDPSWGTFDMGVGSKVISVFGGAADREAYGETEDFVAKRVPSPRYSDKEKDLHLQYSHIRQIRETQLTGAELESQIGKTLEHLESEHPQEWLPRLEILELLQARLPQSQLLSVVKHQLEGLGRISKQTQELISDGLRLAGTL